MIEIFRDIFALLGVVIGIHLIIKVVSASLLAIITFDHKRRIAKEVLRCTLVEIAKNAKLDDTSNAKNTNESEQNTQN